MDTSKEIRVKHRFTIFHNELNKYTIAKFFDLDSREEIIGVGTFDYLDDSQVYRLFGQYTEHPKYGFQFKINKIDLCLPDEKDSLIQFFSGDAFPGIGKKTAENIVNVLGETAISKIQENSELLNLVKGLNEKKKQLIRDVLNTYKGGDEFQLFCDKYGISLANKKKIEDKYGEEAFVIINENPYRISEEIAGIGFQTADKVASAMQFEPNHPYRLRAAFLSCVSEICMRNGDTFCSLEQVCNLMKKRFGVHEDFSIYLDSLIEDGLVYKEDEMIFHHSLYESEIGIAKFLRSFPYVDEDNCRIDDIDSKITQMENKLSITYDNFQKEAMIEFFENPLLILSGGPGTGKTTIVKGIIDLCKKYYPNASIACCAPTGRASKRLSELCDISATTIHSLLKWDLERSEFKLNEKDPINADFLIIDEFSMVDQVVFYHLLKASNKVSKILLIGDEDQLPSVGPGCVLRDLIASMKFPCVKLNKIFRQKEDSEVISLAHNIKYGNISDIDLKKDIAFFNCKDYEVSNVVLQIVQNAIEKGYEEKDIQVLAPMYGGAAGIDILNKILQKSLNPPQSYLNEIQQGFHVYREGDKVLQLKNQPDENVYNGDIGFIEEIIPASEDSLGLATIIVNFDNQLVEYRGEQIYNITHAYCISVHKSQGSEYPIVILPIVPSYGIMLQKRLLYTAITRAKKSLVLLGNRDVFFHAIKEEEKFNRQTNLKERILKIFE